MKTTVFIFTICFVLSFTCKAQWVQTNGPGGGIVNYLTASNSNLIAGSSYYGVFTSTDNGQSWIPTTLSSSWSPCHALGSSGSIVYTCSGSSTTINIYRSTNSGLNWTQLLTDCNATCFAVNGNNVFFIGTMGTGAGLYRSTDLGQNWVRVFGDTIPSSSIAINGNIIYAGTNLYGVYRSTNNGGNWASIGLNLSQPVTALALNGNILYAGVTNHGIYYTSNNGQNWIQTSLSSGTITSFTINSSYIFASAGGNYVYRSSDGGLNWVQQNFGQTANWLATIGSNTFCATQNMGVYITTNYGANWTITSFPHQRVWKLASNGALIASGTDYGVFTTTNTGTSWTLTSLYNNTIQAVVFNGANIWAGAMNGPYISTNNGLNWSLTTLNEQVTCMTQTGNYVFAGTVSHVFRTTDNGQNWTVGPSASRLVDGLGANGSYIFACLMPGLGQGGIYVSSDYGLNWTQVDPNLDFYDFAVSGSNVFAAACGASGGVYKTTNNGVNWIQTSLTAVGCRCIVAFGSTIITGTNSGVYASTNNGLNWVQRNEGMGAYVVYGLTINNGIIYAGTNGFSVWKRPIGELVGLEPESKYIPLSFSLYQNYPNPFNPTTKIKFSIPHLSFGEGTGGGVVKLTIFDILGREVTTLVNEKLSPGTFEVEFDGSNYPSGVYFYKLIMSDPETSSEFIFSETKKLILLK